IIDYTLASVPQDEITLDVLDASGVVVRHLSSRPSPPVAEAVRPPEPDFWVAPSFALPFNPGANRAHWDLRADPPAAFIHTFELTANPGLTAPAPEGSLVLPGTYTLRLTVNGRPYTQMVTVRNDPRSSASPAALLAQHTLLMNLT